MALTHKEAQVDMETVLDLEKSLLSQLHSSDLRDCLHAYLLEKSKYLSCISIRRAYSLSLSFEFLRYYM